MYNPVKKLGQNFLNDRAVSRKMVGALDLSDGDLILEIGPGLGALTGVLLDSTDMSKSKIIAVDIDERFVKKLSIQHVGVKNFDVIEADILDFLPTFESAEEFKIIGSLPYYITSPILHAIVKMKNLPQRCVLLVQKEVAQKVSAKVPEATYLSTFVQTFFDVELSNVVPKDRFSPRPKVDGGILVLTKRQDIPVVDIKKYEGFLHKGFKNRRKMIKKAFSVDDLGVVGIDPAHRPQHISLEEWLKLFDRVNKNGKI